MIIEHISLNTLGKYTTLSASVTLRDGKQQTAYFSTDSIYKDYITGDASPFLAAFLLMCMKRAENMQINASVSGLLLENLHRFMDIATSTYKDLSKIDIVVDGVTSNGHYAPFCGSIFNGNIDSFFTVLQHREEITHLILIPPFERYIHSSEFIADIWTNVQPVARECTLELVVVDTNIHEIIGGMFSKNKLNLVSSNAAISLFLRRGFTKVFLPESKKNRKKLEEYLLGDTGSFFQTDTMRLLHDGSNEGRFDKILAIAKSSLAFPFFMRNIREKERLSLQS